MSNKPDYFIRTLRVRIKDRHRAFLRQQAREVNLVWNFVNELSQKILSREQRFASAYDLHPYTTGATKAGLSLHSQSVQAVTEEYVTRRRQFKKAKLAWRVSQGARRSLGWIPVKASALSYVNGQIRYCGQMLCLWDSYGLRNYALGAGSFSEDARGRWYLNVTVREAKDTGRAPVAPRDAVGIDLGLKELAATSDGDKIRADRFYRQYEQQLATAQRARKRARVRALNAKIKNSRRDVLHKESTRIVRNYQHIFIGNVSPKALTQTRMAKSVLDAGWGSLKTMLQYKSDCAERRYFEVNEAYSSQTCSSCLARSGPKGLQGLGIRAWTCQDCGASHDRDVNAAKNILAAGRRRLAVGIPCL